LLARRDRGLLVVSNRPATIRRADHVIRLVNGRTVHADGSGRPGESVA
jgi:ABC-type multidrug transport system fused ATPase/permease subunit